MNEEFFKWITDKLDVRYSRFVPRYKQWSLRGFTDSRVRHRLSDEVVKCVYDTWVENSITSTDGRNGRSIVTIKKNCSSD